jgi:hypothetical protein
MARSVRYVHSGPAANVCSTASPPNNGLQGTPPGGPYVLFVLVQHALGVPESGSLGRWSEDSTLIIDPDVDMSESRTYSDVYFDFVSGSHEPTTGRGTVVDRGDEMILDVLSEGITYVITGKSYGSYFVGTGDGVNARWSNIGSGFIGTWIEEGDEWFFRFAV